MCCMWSMGTGTAESHLRLSWADAVFDIVMIVKPFTWGANTKGFGPSEQCVTDVDVRAVLEGTDYSCGLHSGSCVLCACFCTKFTSLHAVSIGGISCPCEYTCRFSKASFFSAEQDKDGDGARELKDMKSDRMKVLQMNVCSDQEVAQAVDYVKTTLKDPEEGVWASLFF